MQFLPIGNSKERKQQPRLLHLLTELRKIVRAEAYPQHHRETTTYDRDSASSKLYTYWSTSTRSKPQHRVIETRRPSSCEGALVNATTTGSPSISQTWNMRSCSEMYEFILGAAIPAFALRKPEERPSYYRYGREKLIRELVLDGHKLAAVVQHRIPQSTFPREIVWIRKKFPQVSK